MDDNALIVCNEIVLKPIPGHPNYAAGSDGCIWSKARPGPTGEVSYWRRLKASIDEAGRPLVMLSHPKTRKVWKVCQLILLAWVGPRPTNMEACHDPNPDPTDNRPTNLRWDTTQANKADMIRHGRSAKGTRIGISKLCDADIKAIRLMISRDQSYRSIAKIFGVTHKSISQIDKKKTWSHVV